MTSTPPENPGQSEDESQPVQELRAELETTRATLHAIIQEHEVTNEELRAANEEIQSSNEELQSTNEELETTKEELQSANEELLTLNDELEGRNAELSLTNDTLSNLLASVNIPILMLDSDLRIRTSTPPAQRLLNVRPVDVGRPIREIRLGVDLPNLEERVANVILTLEVHQEDIRADGGRWYSLSIRPYKTAENRIDGAVISLVDVTHAKRVEAQLLDARILAESIIETVRHPMVVLDADLRAVTANPAFYRQFRLAPDAIGHRRIYDLDSGRWNIPELRDLLEKVLPENREFRDYRLEQEFPGLGRLSMRLNARRIEQRGDKPHLILLVFEELAHEGASEA